MTPLGEFRENKLMLIERSSPRHVCALTTAKGYVMSLLEMYRLSVRVLGPDSESAQAMKQQLIRAYPDQQWWSERWLTSGASLRMQCKLGLLDDAIAAYAKRDYPRALQLFHTFADQGNAVAQFALGLMYRYGHGEDAEKRHGLAIKWLRLAADQGNADAQRNLGVLFVRSDYPNGIKWLHLAADQGDAQAQYILGQVFGHHVSMGSAGKQGYTEDFPAAANWYRLAADQGHAEAQCALGRMYAEGQRVAQDYAEAVRAAKWLRAAADQGHPAAQYHLGNIYAEGQGVRRDDAEAVKWFQLAADQDDKDAQIALGRMYPYGRRIAGLCRGVQVVQFGCIGGMTDPANARDMIGKKMTPSQLSKAKRLVNEWKPKWARKPRLPDA